MSKNKFCEVFLGHTEIIMRDDGIVQVTGSNHIYTTADIKFINKVIGDLTNQKKTLILFIASDYSSVDNDAREFMSTSDATIYSIAEAYVIKSLAQRLILNFVIKISGVNVPIRFFDDQQTAINWLYSFKYS